MIEFNQSTWLAPNIKYNTQHQARDKNNFEKNFFKVMNNSVFRDMMKKHRDISVAMSEEVYLKRVTKPNFKSGSGIIFSENLMVCKMGKI